jgi:hypothetical protein
MQEKQRFVDGSVFGRRYDYEDGTVLVADFGPGKATVDVVDGTVIVVAGEEQHEFEVPGVTRAIINNGILTIEISDSQESDAGVDIEMNS